MSKTLRSPKQAFIIFVSVILFYFLISIPIFIVRTNNTYSIISTNMKTDINAYTSAIDDQVANVATNLLLMENLIKNRDILINDNSTLEFKSLDDKLLLENDLLDWIQTYNIYDQIRIIDVSGNEVLRINHNNGNSYVVSDEDLQNKSDRYYFENAIILDDNYIYLSKIDLNIENGVIEYIDGSPKEMLRIASPIYINSQKAGIIIVNYYSNNLFANFDTSTTDFSSFSVININGYFIENENPDIEYGFMFEDKTDETFDKYFDYSIDFSSVTSTQIYQERTSNRLLTYIAIDDYKMESAISKTVGEDIQVYSDNGNIFVFGEVVVSDTSLYQTIKTSYIIVTIFFIIVSLIITRLIDEILYNMKKQFNSLVFSSEHDSLTGLANRKKAFQIINQLNSNQERFTTLFLDLDKFKEVNDSFGHHIGDLLLIEVSNRLKLLLRSSDTISRLGGDEFLIILRDVIKPSSANNLKEKLKHSIIEPYQIEQHMIEIGLSIGISIQDGTKYLDDIIQEADQNMYLEKNSTIKTAK